MPIREWFNPLLPGRGVDGGAGAGSHASARHALAAAEDLTDRKNMVLMIQLRWIAVVGQVVTILVVRLGLGIDLPLIPMAAVLVALIGLNLVSLAWLRHRGVVANFALFGALVCDVLALTVQLYLSGGATNPFIFLFVLQVTLAAVLLDARLTSAIVALTGVNFAALIVSYEPLALPGHPNRLFELYILGALVCFVLDASLLAVFVSRINRNLRERDAGLAAMRQHAAEEDHIVRMGLLASGAAHELGTPLASLAVMLSDWRRMKLLASDPVLLQEIEEMQAEIDRCKAIVTGILLAAGEARGESPAITTMNTFLDGLVRDWRTARSVTTLSYVNTFGSDIAIVSDSALKQVLFNVLDNAFEVSPSFVGLTAYRQGMSLVLDVRDHGPGFAPAMLAQWGKPYHSTKGRLGGGLGLFLVVNVVRKLGGSVSARNRTEGGALVSINLPIAALEMGDPRHAG